MPDLSTFGLEFSKNYCRIWNQHPQICLIAKFHVKAKMSKYGTKITLFENFWTGILTDYCHSWNQQPKICQKWVFNSYSEICFKVRFFKRSGVAFSEDQGPDLGPLYKICLTGRQYFWLKFIVTLRTFPTTRLLRSLKDVFWKRSVFYFISTITLQC